MLRRLLLLASTALAVPHAQAQCLWTTVTPCPQARFEGVPLVIDNELWVFGGFQNLQIQATDRVDIYDPATDTWTPGTPMPIVNTHIGLVKDDREVWMVGGFQGDHPGTAIADVWIYDIDLDTWTPGPALPVPTAGGGCTIQDRTLHYFGGVLGDRNTSVGDHWALDLDNPAGGWSPLAPMPFPRNHLVGVTLGGMVHAIGGQIRHDLNPEDTAHHHVYDPVTDSWTTAAALPFPRSHFEPGTFVLNGEIVITGGKSLPGGSQNLPDVSAYDPATDAWRNLPPLPIGTFGTACKVIGQNIIATTGAANGLAPVATTWVRDKDSSFSTGVAVNMGGGGFLSVGTGIDWCGDMFALNGTVAANWMVSSITGTPDLAVHQLQRYGGGATSDRLDVRMPADLGLQRVRLHFSEVIHGATGMPGPSVGERVFDIEIEGLVVAEDVDIAAEVGVETLLLKTFDVLVEDGDLEVTLRASVGVPCLAGLQLMPVPGGSVERYCSTSPSSVGSPADIGFFGTIDVGANEFTLTASPTPGNFGLFFYGMQSTAVPFGNGTRCVDSPFHRLPLTNPPGSVLSYTVDFTNPPGQAAQISAGETWNFQAWFRDPGFGANFNSSDGLRVTFQP